MSDLGMSIKSVRIVFDCRYIYYSNGKIFDSVKDGFVNIYKIGNDYRGCQLFGKQHYLHRVIYEQFVGEIPLGMEIDHVDDDKLNNDVSNLQLLTKE